MIHRNVLGPLMKVRLPLTENLKMPLAKNVQIPLGLTVTVSATDAAIRKKIHGLRIIALIIANKKWMIL